MSDFYSAIPVALLMVYAALTTGNPVVGALVIIGNVLLLKGNKD